MKIFKNDITSVNLPEKLLKEFPKHELCNTLKEFILLSQKERNALKIKKRNPSLNDNYYVILSPDEYNNRKCKTLRLSHAERRALLHFTKAGTLQDAIIITLCTMLRAKNNEEKTAKEISTDEQAKKEETPISTGLSVMGNKKWFLKNSKKILTEITKDKTQKLILIEPFMGSGISIVNAAHWDMFDDYICWDTDKHRINYFNIIKKYPSRFKSILMCLNSISFEQNYQDNKKVEEMIDIITDSCKLYKSDNSYKILCDLVDAIEYWMINKKIIKHSLPDAENDYTLEEIHNKFFNLCNEMREWKEADKQKRLNKQNEKLASGELKKARHINEKSINLDFVGKASSSLQKINFKQGNSLELLKKYAGKPEYIIMCDPPYIDTKGYTSEFTYEHHKELAKLLLEHQKSNGIFFYFGRPTAPRSLNTNDDIDYTERDIVYKRKYEYLFWGNGIQYKIYEYDKAHGVKEMLTTSFKVSDFLPLDEIENQENTI